MMHVATRAPKSMAEADTIFCPICRGPNPRRAKRCMHCGNDVVLNNAGPSYLITRIIKQGGQGAVYETVGEDGRTYAVKEMLDRAIDAKERAEALARFHHEAALLRRLSHPRIPRVYASFEDEDRHYLAMDFVRGEDLEQRLSREDALTEAQVLDLAAQLCDVLGYLHEQGLIYRDMKPSNVMLDPQGVKLVDFGIARVFEPTDRGTQIGTPGYAPPEQYQGLATPASDIYALGATLHHALTGRDPRDEKPFSFPPVRQLKPQVSQRTADALTQALQMRPDDRFQTVNALRTALLGGPAKATEVLRPVAPPSPPPVAPPVIAARPAPAAPVPVPGVPTARTASPPAAQGEQPKAAQPRARRRWWAWLLALLALLGALGAGAVAVNPDLLAPIQQLVPTAIVPMTTREFTTEEIELVVPTGGDARQLFAAEYDRLAKAKFGPSAQPLSYSVGPIGSIDKIGDEAGGTRYRAQYTGQVSAPSGT